MGLLQDLGIRYVVIHRWAGYDWQSALNDANRLPELKRVGQFGDATVFTLDKGNRVPVVHSLEAPLTAVAGKQFVGDILTRNDNSTAALDTLDENRDASFTWKSDTGKIVSSATVPAQVAVTAQPGLLVQPVLMTAPSQPGNYQLTMSCTCVDQPLVQTVTVVSSGSAPSADNSTFFLRKLTLPPGPYRPGEWLRITAEWEVLKQPNRDLTLTAQLLDDANKVIAQQDGLPFGSQLSTREWHPGAMIDVPLLVQVPEDTAVTSIKVMIAFYDHASPTLERTPIEGPNGVTDLQYLSDPIDVAPNH